MDNSSRNIVKFIATITIAALLIMGARYYAESQKQPMPEVADKATAVDETPAEIFPEDALENGIGDSKNPDDDVIEEDAELIMGEPSVNLEQGGVPVDNPPPPPEIVQPTGPDGL